jgi:hypothetical protein
MNSARLLSCEIRPAAVSTTRERPSTISSPRRGAAVASSQKDKISASLAVNGRRHATPYPQHSRQTRENFGSGELRPAATFR